MSAQPIDDCPPDPAYYFLYARISRDREGKELGVTRQNNDLTTLAACAGAVIVGRYCDNDKSASRFAKKPREHYERMLREAVAMAVAHPERRVVLAAYTTGRITRHPGETQRLIELAVKYGIRFDYINSPKYDLNTADGRMVAGIMSNIDAGEADRISERVIAARRQRRDSGLIDPPASRCFGWEAGGYIVPNVTEAQHVRAIFTMVAAGKGAPDVADYLIKHEVTGTDGSNKWQARKVHNLLRRPTYAALMTNSAGELIKANNVTAVMPVDVWSAAQETLDGRKMATRRPTLSYLLSGMVQCAECGSRMLPRKEVKNKRGYISPAAWACTKRVGSSACGSVSRKMDVIDAMVNEFVTARIESAAAITALPLPTADRADQDSHLARLRASIDSTRTLVKDGVLEPEDGADILRGLRDRMSALEGAQRRALATTARARVTSGMDAAAVWADTSPGALASRRIILEQYVSSVVVGKLDMSTGAKRSEAAANAVTVIPA